MILSFEKCGYCLFDFGVGLFVDDLLKLFLLDVKGWLVLEEYVTHEL